MRRRGSGPEDSRGRARRARRACCVLAMSKSRTGDDVLLAAANRHLPTETAPLPLFVDRRGGRGRRDEQYHHLRSTW